MKYLLDTCVISDFIRMDLNTINKIKMTSPHDIAVSSITSFELSYGLALNPAQAKKIIQPISDFLDVISIIDFNDKDAQAAAQIRATLKKEGTPIGAYDILLAGTAIHRNLILVSANSKEFSRIKNLKLENWRVEISTHS